MIFGARIKELRQEIGLSQEAVGAQGFVSTPGWIKIENGQRQASEKLIAKLVGWLAGADYITLKAAEPLRKELLLLKYLGHSSPFVRSLAKETAEETKAGRALLAKWLTYKPAKKTRGRPAGTRFREATGR